MVSSEHGLATAEDYYDQNSTFRSPPHLKATASVTTDVVGMFDSKHFKDATARRLAGAIRIPTITYDEMGRVGTDPRWNVFYDFSGYLRAAFPQIYEKVEVSSINQHGLLYTWNGSDPGLKPFLLMAHSDVVPAPDSTLDRWTYPPFSGHCDGKYIWGRGSEDDKSNLIAMLTSIDTLLSTGFTPSRTVVVSLGFDEEGGAEQPYGARCLAEHLFEKYGPNGIEMIIDEGIAGLENHFGSEFALPATAEKGYIDVLMTVNTKGGHSSTPPDCTAIGYLARAIQAVEDNFFRSHLTLENPTATYLSKAALHAKNVPESLRRAILDPRSADQVIRYMDSSLETRALVRTSTAVDVIRGGEKANALPETAHALVNHRIAVEDSVQTVKDHYIKTLTPLAKKYNLTLHAFNAEEKGATFSKDDCNTAADLTANTLTLTAQDELEPSPVTDPNDARFGWLTEALHTVFGDEVIVAPILLTGNTDTKFFWNLSTQIYRLSPWRASWDPRGTRMHTVDERMPVEGLMEMVKFYYEFIRVVDAKRL